MNYWFYRFNIIDWRVMDIVLVFIDSQLWHKKLKQQNLLSLSGDKKINHSRYTNTRDLDKIATKSEAFNYQINNCFFLKVFLRARGICC